MAGIRIEIQDDAVRERLRNLLNNAAELSSAMREIGEVLVASTKQRFATETDPDGNRWAENKASTLARKTNPHVLTESGDLGDLIRYQLSGGGTGVTVGTDRVYGAIQQLGGRKADYPHLWGDIPKREFLGVSTDDRERIIEIIRDLLLPSA